MKSDHELAILMANDICHNMNEQAWGDGLDEEGLLDLLDSMYMQPGEYPTVNNYNADCEFVPGVWTYFDGACRYNYSYDGFDEALNAKLPNFEFTDPADSDDSDDNPDAPYTLDDCIEIYEALDDIFAEAKSIVEDRIRDKAETYFDKAMED